MAKICFVCNEKIGTLGIKYSYNEYINTRVPLPEGMTELDVTCVPCYNQAKKAYKEDEGEAKMQLKKESQDLLQRTPEYKKKWNKNGEGYELKAIDEGKTGDAQGISGGVNSYYYFQKNESLLFPNAIKIDQNYSQDLK